MTKKKNKSLDMLGQAIFAVVGFVFGLVLFGILYGWYLTGFVDYASVLLSAIVLIVVIYVGFILAYGIGKKFGMAYEKAIWLGIGFTIAIILAGFILGAIGLTSTTAITTGGIVAVSSKLTNTKPARIKA